MTFQSIPYFLTLGKLPGVTVSNLLPAKNFNNVDEVNAMHPDYEAFREQIQLVNDVYFGLTTSLKHLRQHPAEHPRDFKARQDNAYLNNFVERIITTMAGMVMRKPLVYPEGTSPDEFTNVFNDLSLDDLAYYATVSALREGKAYLVIDRPADGGDPYVTIYTRQQLINWEKDEQGNITMAVFAEFYLNKNGKFSKSYYTQYRVFNPDGTVELYRQSDGGIARVAEFTTPFSKPMVFELDIDDVPPLYDIAKINIAHFNEVSNKDNYLFYCGSPYLFTKGLGLDEGTELHLSINATINTDNTEADVKWIELDGKTISELQEDIKAKETAMAERALKLQHGHGSSIKTAEQVMVENSESNSRLSTIAARLEVALNAVAKEWYSQKYGRMFDGEIEVTRDFNAARADVSILNSLVVSGNLSKETMLKALMKAEVIDLDSIEDEIKRIEAEYEPAGEVTNDPITGKEKA